MIIVITLTKNCFKLFTSAKAVCNQFLRQKTLGQSGKSKIFDQAITVQLIQAKIFLLIYLGEEPRRPGDDQKWGLERV